MQDQNYTPDTLDFDFPCGKVDNGLWFSFYSDLDGNYIAYVNQTQCDKNEGVEIMVYDENLNPISSCKSSRNVGPVFINLRDLEPKVRYSFLIDGINGDECQLFIDLQTEPEARLVDTVICPGSCVTFGDSCYYESFKWDYYEPCSIETRYTVSYYDTSHFEIRTFLDTFLNTISFDWRDLGVDSFDIFINNQFYITQSYSSVLIPITNDLPTNFTLRVEPRSFPNCDFPTPEIDVSLDRLSKIEENTFKNRISVYPNPTKNTVQIQSESTLLQAELFDLNGKKLHISKTKTIDVTALNTGVYFLKITTAGGKLWKKVLKM